MFDGPRLLRTTPIAGHVDRGRRSPAGGLRDLAQRALSLRARLGQRAGTESMVTAIAAAAWTDPPGGPNSGGGQSRSGDTCDPGIRGPRGDVPAGQPGYGRSRMPGLV